jgi:hypothetical protein
MEDSRKQKILKWKGRVLHMSSKIDIVLPWVDGSDPNWQQVKEKSLQKYCPEKVSDSNIRYESGVRSTIWC